MKTPAVNHSRILDQREYLSDTRAGESYDLHIFKAIAKISLALKFLRLISNHTKAFYLSPSTAFRRLIRREIKIITDAIPYSFQS